MDESIQLKNGWRKVCWFGGGVFDYIESRGLEVCGNDLHLTIEEDPFDPRCVELNVDNGLVSKAAPNKKLDKVSFEITHMFEGKPTEVVHTFEWNFSLHDDWVIAFEQLFVQYDIWAENDIDENDIDSVIPLAVVNNYEELMSAKSEEEFLDTFERANLDFKLNLAEEARNHNDEKWVAEFSRLGRDFLTFCKQVMERGFLADRCNPSSASSAFVDRYVELGTKITNSKFSDSLEWVMDYYIHAFAIEESVKAVTINEDADGCIIPPYHPAVLQKISDQIVFIADGCSEWMKANKESHASLDRLSSVIDALVQLSQIHEGVDIFPSKGKSYFGTAKAFANYCICGQCKKTSRKWLKSIMQKDAVFDDDFSDGTLKRMNVSAKMILDVINTYVKALPNSASNLSIAVIDPDDLQPVIAALYQYITQQKKNLSDDGQLIQIRLNILVKRENKGGKNYLSYWANTFFNQDENVDMKIYLNEWGKKEDLDKLLDNNLDLIFLMDVLIFDSLSFLQTWEQRKQQSQRLPFPNCIQAHSRFKSRQRNKKN